MTTTPADHLSIDSFQPAVLLPNLKHHRPCSENPLTLYFISRKHSIGACCFSTDLALPTSRRGDADLSSGFAPLRPQGSPKSLVASKLQVAHPQGRLRVRAVQRRRALAAAVAVPGAAGRNCCATPLPVRFSQDLP